MTIELTSKMSRNNRFTPVTPVNYLELNLVRRPNDKNTREHAIQVMPEWFVQQDTEPGISKYPVGIVQWYINEREVGRLTKYDAFYAVYIVREESTLEGGVEPHTIKDRLRTCTVVVRTLPSKTPGKTTVQAGIEYGDRVAVMGRNRLDVKTVDGRHVFETWQRAVDMDGRTVWRQTYRNVGQTSKLPEGDVPASYAGALEQLYQIRRNINRTHQRLIAPVETNRNFHKDTATPGDYIDPDCAAVVNGVAIALLKIIERQDLLDTPPRLINLIRKLNKSTAEAQNEHFLTNLGIQAGVGFNEELRKYLEDMYDFDADAFFTDSVAGPGIGRSITSWAQYRDWYFSHPSNK